MAADQHLLMRCAEEDIIFVRFYTWQTPSITLGYTQRISDVLDVESINRDGVCWIRRITGGRAVLHFEDLTYSCIFSKKHSKMGLSVQESYSIISSCLMDGLSRVGILCSAHDSYDELLGVKREVKLPCFLTPNRDEIMVNGKKLVGSAQRRNTSGILQHGSIPFSEYYRRLPSYIQMSQDERVIQKRLLERKCTCINEIDPTLTAHDLIPALIEGFKTKLQDSSIVEGWSPEELVAIEDTTRSEEFKKTWLSI
jgi:lipoate-protein ligase A